MSSVLKSLNRPGILSRAGTPSSRNLAKRFRPPRTVIDKKTGEEKLHPLDVMKGGPSFRILKRDDNTEFLAVTSLEEKPRDTTGSFGDVSTFQGIRVDKSRRAIDHTQNPNMERAGRIGVSAGLPGRSGSQRIRKAGGVATPKLVHVSYDRKVKANFYNLRADILSLDILGRSCGKDLLGSSIRSILKKIDMHLHSNCDKAFLDKMAFKDKARESSMLGQISSGDVHPEKIKSLTQRISRAKVILESHSRDVVAKPEFRPSYIPGVAVSA